MKEAEPVSKEQAAIWFKESLERLKNSIEELEANPLLYSENNGFYSIMVNDAKTLYKCRDFAKEEG